MKAHMHIPIIILSLIFGTVFLADIAKAADSTKIAIIDLQQCLNESMEGKRAKKVLEAKNAKLKLRLDAAQGELDKLQSEIEKQGMVLSAEVLQEKERDLRKKQRELKDMVRDFNDEMKEEENTMKLEIFKDLDAVLQKVAKDGGWDIILEKRTVLYSVPGNDITGKVIEAYDAQTAKKGQ
ncbi:MAG: OmpH family outer membrane protein [Deltaproteobacteria bacterium]|nr:OmpH family outer membrane protein [Deltaproteobacteria bacterium]